MRKMMTVAVMLLLGLAATSRAGGLLHSGCCPSCKPVPCPDCPDCSCPCANRLSLNLFGSAHAQKYIEELQVGCGSCGGCGGCAEGGNCCDRIKAAEKLGSRLHADYCSDPCVLDALVGAMQCDKCWEVRRAAAWSIAGQDARSDEAVLGLYIASKLDPHWGVRSRAAEALDIVTRCRAACYKELYERGDKLIKELKEKKWAPGGENCRIVLAEACGACGVEVFHAAAETVPGAPVVAGQTAPLPRATADAPVAGAVLDVPLQARPLPEGR